MENKLVLRGIKNGYCVRASNVLNEEYKRNKEKSLEERKAALKAKLKSKKRTGAK